MVVMCAMMVYVLEWESLSKYLLIEMTPSKSGSAAITSGNRMKYLAFPYQRTAGSVQLIRIDVQVSYLYLLEYLC